MDIMDIGKTLLMNKITGGNNSAMDSVLNGLIGSGAKADVGGLLSSLQSKGLGDIASSWLGDGENKAISVDQLKDVLGGDKIADAAAQLGTDEGSLLDGLKDAIPQMVDKSSSGGSLLDSVGGIGGLASLAKKML